MQPRAGSFGQVRDHLRAKTAKHFLRDEWNVGLVAAPVEHLLARGRLAKVRWLGTNAGRTYLADPIALHGSGDFLAEHFEYEGRARGTIVRCRLDGKGGLAVSPLLETGYHLSYPFVVHDGRRSYLVPEAHEAGMVAMHALDADGTLGPPETLIEGAFVDPTLVRIDGRWWLFCSGPGSRQLFAFHAKSLHGPWHSHLRNPLKTDLTGARPAGPLFARAGRLFRPAQDCSRTYGGAITVHRIVELTPARFHEEFVGRIEPERDGPYPAGVHTLGVLDDCCLVDGKRTVFDPAWALHGRAHGRKVEERRARLRDRRPPAAEGTRPMVVARGASHL